MGIMRRAVKRVLRVVSGSGGPPPSAPSRSPTQAPAVASGSELANIECGGQELKERLEAGESPVIVDVRQPNETAAGIIENALLIPLGELESRWEELKNADEIVCYCALGGRSLQAAGFLRSKGLFNATSMDGGMVGWQGIGGAVVTPASK
jgi:rhodanese-related sulfurtransferase